MLRSHSSIIYKIYNTHGRIEKAQYEYIHAKKLKVKKKLGSSKTLGKPVIFHFT